MPFKKIIFVIFAIIIIFAAGLLIAEIGTRLYLVLSGKGGYIWLPDDYLGKTHASNSKFTYKEDFSGEFVVRRRANSLSLIGREISLKKPKDIFRILVLGDSFTEGLQVKEGENFCEQLEYLNKIFQVLNAGIAGFSPISEYLYLKRELLKFSPDAVVLQLFVNDVFEDNKIGAMSVVGSDGLPVKINLFFTDKNSNFTQVNTLYRFKKILYHSRLFQAIIRASARRLRKSNTHKQMIAKEEFNDHNQFFIIQGENHLFRDENFRNRTLNNTQRYILAMKKLAQEKNIPFFVFLIPASAQVYINEADFKPCLYFDKPPNTYLNKVLEDFCLRENIPYLDLLKAFKEDSGGNLYFKKDFHLTALGHKLTAENLSVFLKDYLKQ